MPVDVIMQSELAEMYALPDRPVQYPATKLIFDDIHRGHGPDRHVMQCDRNRRGDLVATKNPRHAYREKRFQRIQRREPKKNSGSRTKSDRMRSIGDRNQRHVMRDQPTLHARQRFW